MNELQANNDTILLPSVSVSELLVGMDPAKHADFIAKVSKRFFCPSFDIRATELAAKLFMHNKSAPVSDRLERKILKSDVLILSSARISGATVFYTGDKKCRSLARVAGMDGRDLPVASKDMFENAKFRRELGLPE